MNFAEFLTEIRKITDATKKWRSEVEQLAAPANINGLQSISKQFSLLAGSIGQVLMPGLHLMAAAVGTIADAITFALAPNMDDVADLFSVVAIGMVSFTDTIIAAAVATKEFIQWVLSFRTNARAVGIGANAVWETGKQALLGMGDNAAGQALGVDKKGKAFDTLESFIKNLQAQNQESAMSLNKPGFSSIGDAWKKVQLSSFISELDRKRLEQGGRIVEMVGKILQRLNALRPAVGP